MLPALLIILGTRELHGQRGNNSSRRSASFRCQMAGTLLSLLVHSRDVLEDAVTDFPMAVAVCTPPGAHLRGCWPSLRRCSRLALAACPYMLVPSRLSAFLHLWIQRQGLKANVLEHIQNLKINDTCHYKVTCWSSHAWTSVPYQSTWCWKGFCCFCLWYPCSAFHKCHYGNLPKQTARSSAQENQDPGICRWSQCAERFQLKALEDLQFLTYKCTEKWN